MMIKEKTHVDTALRYTILQLLFLVLGLLIVYILPVFFIVIPLIPLLFISYVCGIISVIYIIKGRKESSTNKKWISIIITSFVLIALTILAIYTIQNQTIF
ncbi:hypothetical protein [Polaribacter uvawellassae]|uniref:hypothetical protein n=1 Tax=Polaribacter uvawellassae TaxID=3133495 RepID=UPI003219F882